MMTPDDSDEDNSSVEDMETDTEKVPNLPNWMQGGSEATYGTASYSDTESDSASEGADGHARPTSNWMRPNDVPAYASAHAVSYTDSSDNESVSTEASDAPESHQMISGDRDNSDSKPRALSSLAHWIRKSGSSSNNSGVGSNPNPPPYASAPVASVSDSDSEDGSGFGRDVADYQDDNGTNFRDLEQHQDVRPPPADAVRTANNRRPNLVIGDPFVDEGVVVSSGPIGQGHRHGATVYDDWGLPISNPANFREGRNMCRPWLVAVNIFAIFLVIGIIVHGGPSSGYDRTRGRYNWLGQFMDTPETSWGFIGEELVGPVPEQYEAENRLVGFGHHVTMNEKGDRVAIARTSGHRNTPGEVYVYSWRNGSNRKHNHTPKPGKWRLEQILTAKLAEDDVATFHAGQQHTPLAMSASGHRIAFTEGDHVFIFESMKTGDLWEQIAKVQSLDHDYEDELEQEAAAAKALAEPEHFQTKPPVQTTPPVQATSPVATTAEVSATTKAGLTEEHKALNSALGGALDMVAEEEDDDDDDDDDGLEEGGRRRLGVYDFEKGSGHFGKHLAFSHDGKTLAIMGFSKQKGGYVRVFQDEKEEEDHEVKHLFEATPDIFLEETGDSLALSGDGKTLAIGIATSDDLSSSGSHNGVVQVFALGMDEEWYRVGQAIFGDYPMEGFGGSVSLSENGLVLAVGVAYGGGPVKIFEVMELDHFGKKWHWQQMGQTLHGSNHREHFGAQVKLNYDGTLVAVGAPGSPELLEMDVPIDDEMETFLHGRAYMFGYDKEESEWQNAGHAVSAYEADAFGYSLAISGDGDRVVVGAPFRIVGDEVIVGVVEVFGINQ